MPKPNFIKLIFFAFFILMCLGCFYIQKQIDFRAPKIKQENMLYLPSGKYLKPLTLGFNHFTADLLWLKSVVYFGQHCLENQDYPWLYHMLDLITTLDPLFQYAYEFGGIILSIEKGEVAQSNALLKKGIKHFPEYWRLYFYLGFNYFYHLNDPVTALQYIEKAVALPDHPTYLPKLVASFYAASGKPEAGIEFLTQVYQNTEDEMIREQISKKIADLCEGKLPSRLQKYRNSKI